MVNIERAVIEASSRYMQYSLNQFGRELEESRFGPSIPLLREYRRLNRPIQKEMSPQTYEVLAHKNVVIFTNHSVDPGLGLASLPPRADGRQFMLLSVDNKLYMPRQFDPYGIYINIDHEETDNDKTKRWREMKRKSGLFPHTTPQEAEANNLLIMKNAISDLRTNGGALVMISQGTNTHEWTDGAVNLLSMLARKGFYYVHGAIVAKEKVSPGIPAPVESRAYVKYGEPMLASDAMAAFKDQHLSKSEMAKALQLENEALSATIPQEIIDACRPLITQKQFWTGFAVASLGMIGASIVNEYRNRR